MRNQQATQLLFELSQAGRRSTRLPACDVPVVSREELLPENARAESSLPLPALAEPDIIRHFTNLSTLNMSIDTHFYPLGSCTMKYNSKRNERMANLPGLSQLHPYQPASTVQGLLQLLFELQQMLQEISGLPGVSLQPAAGAHGELTALMVAASYFRDHDEQRTKVLSPDSAHGTNPASAQMAGFDTISIKSNAQGLVDLDDLPWGRVSDPDVEGAFAAANAAGADLSGVIVDENTVDDLDDLDALWKAFKVKKKINHETEDASGTIEIGTINGEPIATWNVMGYTMWMR